MPPSQNAQKQSIADEMQIMMVRWMWHTLGAQSSFVPFCLAPSLVCINPQVLEEKPSEPSLNLQKEIWLPSARLLLPSGKPSVEGREESR